MSDYEEYEYVNKKRVRYFREDSRRKAMQKQRQPMQQNEKLDKNVWNFAQLKLGVARKQKREGQDLEAQKTIDELNKWLLAYKHQAIEDPTFIYTLKGTDERGNY